MNEGVWGIVVVVGPILLAAAIAFAILSNRKRSPKDIAHTENATRDLYDQKAADARAKADERI